jgi:hypothetical protein
VDEAAITARFVALEPILDEQLRRLVAAAEAQAAGLEAFQLWRGRLYRVERSELGKANWTAASFQRGKRKFEGRSPNPKTGWGTEEERRQRSDSSGGSGEVGGARHAGSGIPSAMDVQERSCSGLRA